jgi:hypothetical protein
LITGRLRPDRDAVVAGYFQSDGRLIGQPHDPFVRRFFATNVARGRGGEAEDKRGRKVVEVRCFHEWIS